MTLQAGRTLGHYEILSTLGAGGMGEVYRARDTRLGREVAIKLLLEEVASDPERLARFDREARVLASLNHPHIATIHGFETDGATKFMVMELVEGETLADRIASGPIPIAEAITIFLQIAEGLEAAHERGVVHRDLKPANIKLSAGRGSADADAGPSVKILDFGLAKAMEEETAAGSAALSHSPTLTLAATQRGQILGTAAYMSPQQAQGQPVDRRADVWAFGACLFEALAGRQAFAGENASLVLASVLKDDPDWQALPAQTPPALRRLLRRCLEKSARARLPHIGAARLELEEALVEARAPRPSAGAVDRAHLPRRSLARAIALALTCAIALGSAVVSVRRWRSEPARDSVARSPLRYTVNLADLKPRFTFWGGIVRISPDGSLLAILAGNGPGSRVYLRRRGSLELEPLAGTHNAWYTQFSPDGQWLLFSSLTRNSIHRIPIAGGAALPVLAADGVLGFDCDGSNRIVYDTVGGLRRTSISGGEVEALTSTRETHGVQHRFPQVLPWDRGVLFTVISGNRAAESSVVVLDDATKEVRTLLSGARYGRYASSGHLVYGSEGGLYAVPFDLDRLTIAGTPARVVDDVYQIPDTGLTFYSMSDTGTLAYLPAREGSAYLSLSWLDRTGRSSPLPLPHDDYATPALSPDGRALAVTARDEVVWFDLGTGRKSQLTDGGQGAFAIWASGGDSLVYSNQQGADTDWNIYRREAVGVAAAEMLAGDRGDELPYSIHGDTLLYGREGGAGGFDLYTLDLDEPGAKPAPLVSTEADTAFGQFSPDGRWVVYEVWQEGLPEIWVEPIPTDGSRRKISGEGGGYSPVWSPAEREIFYVEDGRRMMSVRYTFTDDGAFEAGAPRLLFERSIEGHGYPERVFDVTPDGQRFLVVDAPDTSRDEIVVVENWFAELERLVPTK